MTEYLRPSQVRLLEEVDYAVDEAKRGVSKGVLLIGESGTGKTHAFDHLTRRFQNSMEGTQRIVPAVRISLSTKADAPSIIRSAGTQLNRPLLQNPRDKISEAEKVLYDAIRACKTSVVMLEEFHNGLLASTPALRSQNSQFLKNLWNLHDEKSPKSWVTADGEKKPYGLVVVVSATEKLLKPLSMESELDSRFTSRIFIPKLHIFSSAAQAEFRYVLRGLLRRHGISERLSINNLDFVAQMYFASGGHLRNLDALIQRVASLLKRSAESVSARDLLITAFEQVGGSQPGVDVNPFSWSADEISSHTKMALLKHESRPKVGK